MGHVNVPEGLKEIIQQNNEKPIRRSSWNRHPIRTFSSVGYQGEPDRISAGDKADACFRAECRMRCTDRKTAFYGVTCDGSGGE